MSLSGRFVLFSKKCLKSEQLRTSICRLLLHARTTTTTTTWPPWPSSSSSSPPSTLHRRPVGVPSHALVHLSRLFSSSNSNASSRGGVDHYETLRVNSTASQGEIKAQFFKLSKQFHPDVNEDEGAALTFQRLVDAYQVLSNAKARREYDDDTLAKRGKDVVEDMMPPGWKEQKRRADARKRDREQMDFSKEDLKRARQSAREAADEVHKNRQDFKAQDYQAATQHELGIWWTSFGNILSGFIRRYPYIAFAFFLYISYYYLSKFNENLRARDTNELDLGNTTIDTNSYDDWMSSELDKRKKWTENKDRLEQFLDGERKEEHVQNLRRSKAENPLL